jgi:uncharacterized protein DUF4190
MKYCPQCNKQFTEAWLSFCSDDGTPLVQELTPAADPNWDPKIREPKVQTGDERETVWLPRDQPLPGGWIAPDERPPMSPGPWQPAQQPARPDTPFAPPYPRRTQPNQGLALASMITGICGLVLSFCFGPIPGIVALVLGIIALTQIKKSPEKFGGKPFAIAGVIIGGVSVAFYALMFIWFIIISALG